MLGGEQIAKRQCGTFLEEAAAETLSCLYHCRGGLHISSSSKRTRFLTDGVFKSASSTELALVASGNIGNLFLICIKTLF